MARTDAERLELLRTERDAIETRLSTIATVAADSASQIGGGRLNKSGGEAANHEGHWDRLRARLAELNQQIIELEAIVEDASGPYMLESRGVT
jgi:hypothetical protein